MNVLQDQQQHAFAASPSEDRPVPMRRSRPIEVDGTLVGEVERHELGVRFIAMDVRVTEMDQSIWPNLGYAYRSTRQLFKSTRSSHPF
jgi:hypothetical protein